MEAISNAKCGGVLLTEHRAAVGHPMGLHVMFFVCPRVTPNDFAVRLVDEKVDPATIWLVKVRHCVDLLYDHHRPLRRC